ncbi:DUF3617 family protein [Sphingorhabdus sp. Alg239-R122]|uniref:DUF3617 domain-containing protein n=1 Tax=Sphingorhabdus sp. Alg239-R122 TaxID=2305989 RepID=UPI001F086372|nr:DUF3617 family protein [Sphingorhabdus sp. Alg239-R122]
MTKRLKMPFGALKKRYFFAMLATAPLALFAMPAPAQAPELASFKKVDAGQWEIRPRAKNGEVRRICVRDIRQLLNLRHQGENCKKPFVIEDKPNTVTVSYSCGARGHGRTTLRAEGADLLQINTQGIANGSPFSFAAEGRRVGSC